MTKCKPMDIQQLFAVLKEVRQTQRTYYRTDRGDFEAKKKALLAAKAAEQIADQMIAENNEWYQKAMKLSAEHQEWLKDTTKLHPTNSFLKHIE
jgi:hypothetical protein